jgi:uncharacterized protein (TIGR02145 family)
MKYIGNLFLLSVLSLSFFVTSCEDDDKISATPTIQVSNQSPVNKASAIGFNPIFSWEASGDNLGSFQYDFYIGSDSTKLGLRAENIKELEYKITNNTVVKGGVYYWKVIAKDGIYEEESDVWRFNTADTISVPVLNGPANGFGRDIINFEWVPNDVAVDEKIKYNIYVGKTDPPTELIETLENASSYSYDASGLDEFEQYYWRVEVLDSLSSAISEVRTFQKLKGGYPDLPFATAPMDKSVLFAVDGDVVLDWTDSTDPEGDTVVYDVYLDKVNPPLNKVTSFSGDSTYTPVLEDNTEYFWYVNAKDASGNFYSTEILSFQYIGANGPGACVLNDVVNAGVLFLDESLVYNTLGATSYDVYIGEANPPVTKVASDINTGEYKVQTADTPSDINSAVKTFYARVVAKNSDGESESNIISFTPQMTGVMTDVRGTESIDYPWVRIGGQVWMSQNLRTKKLTNGEDLSLAPGSLTSATQGLLYDHHDNEYLDVNDWQYSHGLVYSQPCVINDNMAPDGWHVMSKVDVDIIKNYISPSKGSVLMGAFHDNGSDVYGLNMVTAGRRYANGWSNGVDLVRTEHWLKVDGFNGDPNSLEIFSDGSNDNGFRFYKQGNSAYARMWGLRLVKD